MQAGISFLCLPVSLDCTWAQGLPHGVTLHLMCTVSRTPTFLTVRLSILHVEETVPKGLLAGRADETGGVPCLSQSVHHFLEEERFRVQDRRFPRGRELGLASAPGLAAARVT